MLLLLAVGIGNQVSVWPTALTDLTFPAYIGAMLVAVVVRNVMDGAHTEYPAEEIDTMGNMFLSIFLAMALAGLKLWELIDLASADDRLSCAPVHRHGSLFLLLWFRVMGRGYDAAVMTAGFIGFCHGGDLERDGQHTGRDEEIRPSPVAYFRHSQWLAACSSTFYNAVLIAANISWWA